MTIVLARTSQAQHDFRTPVASGVLAVFVNLILCTIFVRYFDVWCLALAASIASTANGAVLFVILWKRLHFSIRPVLAFGLKVIIAASGMALACLLVLQFLPYLPHQEGKFLLYSIRVVSGMTVSLLVYAGLGWLLFSNELKAVLRRK